MQSEIQTVPFRSVVSSAIGGGWGNEAHEEGCEKVAVVRGTDFFAANHSEIDNVPIRFETSNKVAKRSVEEGDLLLEISGGSKNSNQPTGRSLLIQKRFLDKFSCPVIPASFCRLIRLNRSMILPAFAYYCLQDMYNSRRVEGYEHHSTGISNFQFEYFLDAELIQLPPLPEQKAIARVLASLDDKIELNRRTNATLEALAQTLFRAWFVDFVPVKAKAAGVLPPAMDAATAALFPSQFQESTPGLIPKGWEISTMAQSCDIVTRGVTPSYSTGTKRFAINQKVNRGAELNWREMKELSEDLIVPTEKMAHKFDILVNCLGEGTLGRVHLYLNESNKFAVDQHMSICRFRNKNLAYLVYQFMAIPEGQSKIESLKTGSTGMTMFNISKLREYDFVVPTDEIIQSYAGIVAPLWEQTVRNREQSQTLAALRDALLPRLISGRLRVPEAMRAVEAIS